ncbi:uncharacterized protein K452DRAFT_302429 [Aplosporella prunicola CBS 121167]|uniref:Uncharacterized protein n=1 Tax=Aplosporella prunicola CBS 121167 TaxID=1176127 RepID=A0A6A6AYX9_9PEZI|nr:uncharacterized protein K452DRAFT_302429 [Aplosporella prunicola CBS 121167]KAF2136826.1 hypothetical protein K452DRAFT_302429 [Aplosporella prunicola CBS 121167]
MPSPGDPPSSTMPLHTRSSANEMPVLPVEVIMLIYDNVIEYDPERQIGDTMLTKESRSTIYAMRSVSRKFLNAGNAAMGQAIASRQTSISPGELSNLLNIMEQNPKLASNTKALSIKPGRVDETVFDALNQQLSSATSDAQAEAVRANIGQLECMSRKYKKFIEDGQDINLLVRIVSLLPNLSTIYQYQMSGFCERIGNRRLVFEERLGKPDGLGRFGTHLAYDNSGALMPTLKSIRQIIDLSGSDYPTRESLVRWDVRTQRTEKESPTIASNIKELSVVVKCGDYPLTFRAPPHHMGLYVDLYTNLEKLELTFDDSNGSQPDLDWLLAAAVSPGRLKKLRSIFLDPGLRGTDSVPFIIARLGCRSLRHARVRLNTPSLEILQSMWFIIRMWGPSLLKTLVIEFSVSVDIHSDPELTYPFLAERIYIARSEGPCELWTPPHPFGKQKEVLWMPKDGDWSRVTLARPEDN